jgi:hypothetical protein
VEEGTTSQAVVGIFWLAEGTSQPVCHYF